MKAKIVDAGYNYEVLLNYDHLQRTVRKPDYIKLCEDLIFDEDGFAIIDLFQLGLITYLLLAIYCHTKHGEPVGIERVRALRTQIQNELRDSHRSTDFIKEPKRRINVRSP